MLEILRAFAANPVRLQACRLYKMRTYGHSPGNDFFPIFDKAYYREATGV